MPISRLFSGGTIRTISTAGLAEAILVMGDCITAVGTLEGCAALAPSGTKKVDFAGTTLLPGFVDAHTHPLMLANVLPGLI
ncbi:MAG TPA: hypothetical protein EYG34_09115 [Acidimicrobiia bacterium]|jgi:predicted amidohydrolase YtcJ|nr:hypothetical protein [Acidimicrobiia bacterium]HIL47251.1 hypothetical protein [Acidimicrobiia bacterium]